MSTGTDNWHRRWWRGQRNDAAAKNKLSAVLVAALTGKRRRGVDQGQPHCGLGEDPGRIEDGHGKVAISENERDLSAAGDDRLGAAILEVGRSLSDQAAGTVEGLPLLDGVDGLHDARGLEVRLAGQDRQSVRFELLLEHA
jgi:hypothetical protein